MKIFKILGISMLAVLFTACSGDELKENAPVEFKVVSTISPSTPSAVSLRAQMAADGSGKFETGDKNTLFFHNGETALKSMSFEYGKTYYWYDLKLPQEVSSCMLSASYPEVTTDTPATFDWNVNTQAANPDLLLASPVKVSVNSAAPIHLTFSHVMHRFVVEMTSDETGVTDDVLNTTGITVNKFKPTATVNLLTGKSTSAKGENATASETGKKAEFIIPAQAVADMDVTVKLDGKTKTFKLADCEVQGQKLQNLESGKTFTLKIKATKGGFVISGQDISAWGDQGSFEDSMIL